MRCSSCEPLLDRYVEGTLTPRQMLAVSSHLQRCEACGDLLNELRVVDALISTTQPVELAPNFSFAVMAEVRGIPMTQPRRFTAWAAIAFYIVAAWILAGGILLAFGPRAPWIAGSANAIARTWNEASITIGGVVHGLSGVSLLVPGIAAILAFDALLLVGSIFFYRTVRPRLMETEAQ